MNTSSPNNPSRRTVLKSIGVTTTVTVSGLLPSAIYAATPTAANDKLRVGLIGAGNRAKWRTRALSRESHRAELVAVCDCYLPQIDALAYQALEIPEEADRRLAEALGSLQHGKFSFASILDNLELLASILREQGDEKRAEEVLQLSLAISEEQHFEDWRKPQTLSLLAEISMAQQQPAKAREQLLEACRILDEYSNEAERRVRTATHGEKFNRVYRRLMQQIVAMSESLNDISEAGDWQSKLDAIDSSVPPQLLKTHAK
jgi:hypothetical protein